MIFLLNFVVALVALADGQVFLDLLPTGSTGGSTFADCPNRFRPEPLAHIQGFGGVRAFQGEFQHMAVLGWTRSSNVTAWLCGGTLITWQFVLTAAHCATDSDNIAPDTVRLGDTDLGSTEDDDFAVQVPIDRFIKHPNYRASRRYYDVALIKLGERIRPSGAVCVACIWREPEAPSVVMEAMGFGALGYGEDLSPTLQKVQVSALSAGECAKRFPTNRRQLPEGLRADQFCAASAKMDTCAGDSGGPLQTERPDLFGNLFPLVVGIVSFGTACGEGSTGAYTRVSSYIGWIEAEVNQSLSYDVCTRANVCERNKDPLVSSDYHQAKPHNRFGLLWDEAETDIYQCGAVLVEHQYLLTSADCVTSERGYPRFIASTAASERVPIADVLVHPRFERGKPTHDIALIELRKFANHDEALPACPWNRNNEGEWVRRPSFTASIPARGFYGDRNNSRHELTISPLGSDRCLVGAADARNGLYCVSRNVTLVPGTCKIDYGGPVMAEVAERVYRVYGVLSHLTQGCGSDIIFTEITPYIEWMESVIFKELHKRLLFAS